MTPFPTRARASLHKDDYTLSVGAAPAGMAESVVIEADGDGWEVTVPREGGFAGEYELKVEDPETGWTESTDFNVPLEISVGEDLLGLPGHPTGEREVTVRGAQHGESVTFALVGEDGNTLTDPPVAVDEGAEATDEPSRGNPAVATLEATEEVEDSLMVWVEAETTNLDPVTSGAIEVLEPASLEGQLIDEATKALDHGRVSLIDDDSAHEHYTVLVEDGDFELALPKRDLGDGQIRIEATGYEVQERAASAACWDNGCSIELQAVDLPEGLDHEVGDGGKQHFQRDDGVDVLRAPASFIFLRDAGDDQGRLVSRGGASAVWLNAEGVWVGLGTTDPVDTSEALSLPSEAELLELGDDDGRERLRVRLRGNGEALRLGEER